MPVPVARPVNLLHDFATRLYDYLGGNNTHHVHCCWSFRLARHASGASSLLPCTIFARFQYISQECHRWYGTLAL
jgi:hypothetical protein